MAFRTTSDLVKGILGPGPRKYNYDGSTPLTPFITAANNFVTQAKAIADNRGYSTTDGPDADDDTASLWGLLERWIAAHFYQVMDQGYQSRSTEGASGQFTGQTGKKLESTYYGQAALAMDWTGSCEILDKRKIASLDWGGKPPSQQIPYCERD